MIKRIYLTLLRDYFACKALSNPNICNVDSPYPQKDAYNFADTMLKERNK